MAEHAASDTRPIYAIGDIHGCRVMLEALLGKILADRPAQHGDPRKRLVFLGDYVDRGPDSRGVLDLLISRPFRATFEAVFLRGNHDDWMIEALANPGRDNGWLRIGGIETAASYGVEADGDPKLAMQALNAVIPAAHLAFLRATWFSFCAPGFVFVHGGLEPGVPLARQSPAKMMWIRDEFLDFTGDFGARVVHGHSRTPSRQVEIRHNRISVDTGCGFPGGSLSAAVIEADGKVTALSAGPAAPYEIDLAR